MPGAPTAVITRIWLALAPAVDWTQCIVAFDTYQRRPSTSRESIATEPNGPSAWHRFRVAHPLVLHSHEDSTRRRSKALISYDRHGSGRRVSSDAARAAGGEITFQRSLSGPAHAAAAQRLHLEPHHALGHEGRRRLHLSAMRLFDRHRARAVSQAAREASATRFSFTWNS